MAVQGGKLAEKLALRKAIGVYVDEEAVTVCQIALGPFGMVELVNRSEPYQPETFATTLEELLKPLLPVQRASRTRVSIGLPALRVFFASRALSVTDRNTNASGLLHDLLKSSDVNVDDMEVDVIKAQPAKKPLAILVAGRRKYLTGLLATFEKCGVRPYRTEPAPFALLRLAAMRHHAPKKARTVVRAFLGDGRAIAVLVVGQLPLAWRAFDLPAGMEEAAIRAAVKSIQIVARFRGEIGGCDAVMLHGRSDLASALTSEPFRQSLGTTVKHETDPGLDGPSVALGLALGAQETAQAFDLSRMLKPKPPIWEIVPFGDIAVQAALLSCVTMFLSHTEESGRHDHARVATETAKHAWMKKFDDTKLDKERKDLEAKVVAIKDFLESRVRWTEYTRDAARRLPEEILLQSLTAVNELQIGKPKAKKSLVLKVSTPITGGKTMPREIDEFLTALRRDPLLQRDFPLVELADLTWNQPGAKGALPLAQFTVHCLPGEKPKAPPPAPAAKKH